MRHLTEDDIEEMSMGRTDGVSVGWREQHLLLCEDCSHKVRAELEYVCAIRVALRSFTSPATPGGLSIGTRENQPTPTSQRNDPGSLN